MIKINLAAVLMSVLLPAQNVDFSSAPRTEPIPQDVAAKIAYVLGPNDQLSVFVDGFADEFVDKTFRIDINGDLSLPIIGHLHAGGRTIAELELSAREAFRRLLNNPDVAFSLVSYGSQSIYVLGAVNNPGMHQLEGQKNLFEILSLAGGLDYENAGYLVKVTRSVEKGPIPLPNVKTDSTGHTYIATVRLKDLVDATNPVENIAILPGDTVSVPRTDLVYAVGSVLKPGGFPMKDHESLSALQVVSLAGGLQRTASTDKAQILRTKPGSSQRVEIAVDLKSIMAGKGVDVPLQPDDILFIPNSKGKSAGYRTVDAIVAAATGAVIYGTRF